MAEQNIPGWTHDWSKIDKEYIACGGRVKFTNRDATHAVRHFHDIVDLDRMADVPYMLGIMGGCFAHACKWDDGLVTELEADEEACQELFMVWAKMISAYFQALDAGVFAHMDADLS